MSQLYAIEITVPQNTSAENPQERELKIVPGVIKQIDVTVPSGCIDLVRWQIWRGNSPVCPRNGEGYLAGNGMHFSFPYHYEVNYPPYVLIIRTWNLSVNNDHTIFLGVSVGEKEQTLLTSIVSAIGALKL
jgi:hypothetical protein